VAEYVYGIIDADGTPPPGEGIGGAPVRTIGGDGAAALVSDIPSQELMLDRGAMLTHARVLESALADGTVLPMRFGVIMEGEEVRTRLLGTHRDQLCAQLEQLAGKVELNVRVLYEEESLMRELVDAHPDIAALRARVRGRSEDATYYERIQLGERVADALERRRAADADALLEELSPVSLAVELGAPSHERVVLHASFLVARDGVAAFDDALERQAEARAGHMRFKCVGPLPPHSFVDLGQAV